MKTTILFFLFFSYQISSNSQIVPSACTSPDSIVTKYKEDADRLALRKIYRNNLSFKDSIYIPKEHSDTVLNALIAVYNATALPARDTVTIMFDVHSFPDIVMNNIIVIADSNLNWMQQLKNGIIPTGNPSIDSLILNYHLSIDNYYTFTLPSNCHMVTFKSDSNYNLPPLSNLFDTITGVYLADPNGMCCEGNNIWDSIFADHVELIYSVGWGDCQSGCIERRFWKFNIDFNCSVEFAGSYGNSLPISGISQLKKQSISISPNPFKDFIMIYGISNSFYYSIENLSGQILIKGKSTDNILENLDRLTSGLFFLTIQNKDQTMIFKITKE